MTCTPSLVSFKRGFDIMQIYLRCIPQMWRKRYKRILLICFVSLFVYFTSSSLLQLSLLEPGFFTLRSINVNYTKGSHCISCVTLDEQSGNLMRNDRVFRFIAGQMDYYRIPLEYWEDRVMKAKAFGLDAIEFYIPWNYHERNIGEFDFSGKRNITHYLTLIQKHDMLAVARVGPYICSEWTLGGLPPWLWYQAPYVHLRSSEDNFFKPVENWFAELLPILKPFLQENGGPIFMVQIENEFGDRDNCDQVYMMNLYQLIRRALGNHVIYFTVDMPQYKHLSCSNLLSSEVLLTTDFGPCTDCEVEHFRLLDQFRQGRPLINSEYYTGWFDKWGSAHHVHSAEWLLNGLWRQLNHSERVSLSLYVFHGGTTFGLWNGASTEPFGGQTTSYDYDAPLSEAGDITDKYVSLRNAVFQFKRQKPPALPTNTTKKKYPAVKMKLISHLLHLLKGGVKNHYPLYMEALQQYEGFMVYAVKLPVSMKKLSSVTLNYFADVVHVFTSNRRNGTVFHGTWLRGSEDQEIPFTSIQQNATLLMMVENCGYVNFGKDLYNDRKGIRPPVYYDKGLLKQWTMFPLCFNKDGLHCPRPFLLDVLKENMKYSSRMELHRTPHVGQIYEGFLQITTAEDLGDTFIQPISFGRGLIYINSILLGRYDQKHGPQLSLFVPKPFLRLGTNQIVIVELIGVTKQTEVAFHQHPLWSQR